MQPIACDICGQENAVQILTNTETGGTMALGANCVPVFYGQSLAMAIGAGEHAGPPTKCQTCRRIHEWMAVTTAPAPPAQPASEPAITEQPSEDQPAPAS